MSYLQCSGCHKLIEPGQKYDTYVSNVKTVPGHNYQVAVATNRKLYQEMMEKWPRLQLRYHAHAHCRDTMLVQYVHWYGSNIPKYVTWTMDHTLESEPVGYEYARR